MFHICKRVTVELGNLYWSSPEWQQHMKSKLTKDLYLIVLFVVLFLQIAGFCLAQGNASSAVRAIYLSGELYVALNDASHFVGAETVISDSSLIIRTTKGRLSLTDDSPDVIWHAKDEEPRRLALARPVYKRFDAWYAPDELLAILGINQGINERSTELYAANKTTKLVIQSIGNTFGGSWEIVQFDNNSSALSFYRVNERGEAQQNLFLLDIESLKTIFPEQSNQYERFKTNVKGKNALYFALSSLQASAWQAEFEFRQGSRSFKASYPTEISLLVGDNQDVSPEAPVTGIILLPDGFDLAKDMTISWANIDTRYRFIN